MIGLALIVIALLAYKAYKLSLKHSRQLERLRQELAQAQAEAEYWRARYETLLEQAEKPPSPEQHTAQYLEMIAQRIEQQRTTLL
ncbi:MAG: hypothetical protein NZ958_06400 [Bacteroidia bacterium]|nr:hypothetical protein [Bacteroidia bacterium]MDW8088752.1 hypothetical protein [Bacteroidia bacterium]